MHQNKNNTVDGTITYQIYEEILKSNKLGITSEQLEAEINIIESKSNSSANESFEKLTNDAKEQT